MRECRWAGTPALTGRRRSMTCWWRTRRAKSCWPPRSRTTEAVAQTGSVRPGQEHSDMAQNFIECRREQGFLLPPDVREWLPVDHLAWFVIDAVAEMDLSAFYAAYRADGHGRAAYEPSLMVALILYGSAGINRHGEGDERALHRRSSDPRWPESCVGVREGVGEALVGVRVGWAIEPRNESQ